MNIRSTLAAFAVALVLTGCTGSSAPTGPSATPTSSATASDPSGSAAAGPGPSASPSPVPSSPSATPSAPPLVATIPTDCRALVPAERYDAIFGATPLNDPNLFDPAYVGEVEPVESYPGAPAEQILSGAARLRCEWRDPSADITGISVEVAQADPAIAGVYLDEREVAGEYTCEAVHEGRRCQLIETNQAYPVEQAQTLFARDDVFIRVGQWNFPTDDLLGDIVDAVWN